MMMGVVGSKWDREIVTLTTRCPMCGEKSVVEVTNEEIGRYQKGELIQNAVPRLTAEQREKLLTGFCGECWDAIVREEEEEEEK